MRHILITMPDLSDDTGSDSDGEIGFGDNDLYSSS